MIRWLGILLVVVGLCSVASAEEGCGTSQSWWWHIGCWKPCVPVCGCCPCNYCPKPMPPLPPLPPCGCDDYCPKGMPPLPPLAPCGCDDFVGKCCPIPIPTCCFPWYTCGCSSGKRQSEVRE